MPAARTGPPLAAAHAWHALVETVAPMGAPSPEPALYEALRVAIETGLVEDATIAASEAQANSLWRLRESIAEAERQDGPAAKHDISVAVADMPGFLVEATAAVEQRFPGVRVNAFGHLGDGNLHYNTFVPGRDRTDVAAREANDVTTLVYDVVRHYEGSFSAEHGIGQAKLQDMIRYKSPVEMSLMAMLKRALDPHNLMNPGKVLRGGA